MKKHKATINYGPYMSFGVLEHRTACLEGVEANKLNNFWVFFGDTVGLEIDQSLLNNPQLLYCMLWYYIVLEVTIAWKVLLSYTNSM